MSNALIDLSNDFANAVEHAGRSIVCVREGGRAGVSGTIWRDGLVVTAEHTIRGEQEVTITLPDGSSSTGAVVGRDPTTDLALLRPKTNLAANADFADAAQLRVGHFVLAVGRRPKGLAASHGIISALGAEWRTWRGGRVDHWFRLDLVPFTGFSGGPLVDAAGKIIGINTSGARQSIMTIPAATVDRVVSQLLAKGRVARGFIGVALQPVQLPGTGAAGKTRRGLLIIMVEPGGPAEKAGVIVGDILVGVSGSPLSDASDLQNALDPEQVGKTVQLQVLRGGKAHDITVTVAERAE